MRGFRRPNLNWVLDRVDRFPLATVSHLNLLRAQEGSGPGSTTIADLLDVFSQPARGCAPLFAKVPEPGGNTGHVLTRAGAAEFDRPGSRLGVITDPQDLATEAEWAVQIPDSQRRHARLTTDLGVLLGKVGAVTTEFEARALRPERDYRLTGNADHSPNRRPDLMLELNRAMWAVEIERSEKGSGRDGRDCYTTLAHKHARGGFSITGPGTRVTGVWYVTGDTDDDASGKARRRVADRVLAGMFSAADEGAGDLLIVIDPIRIDEIAEEPFDRRRRKLERLIADTTPMLHALGGGPAPTPFDEPFVMSYVTPTLTERRPTRVRSRGVGIVGELVKLDRASEAARVRVGEHLYRCRGVPSDLAAPLEVGDRVALFGAATDQYPPVITITNICKAGVDWEPTSQSRSAQTRRQKHQERATEIPEDEIF